VQYLPTTFYIGRDGPIVDKMTGLLDRKEIETAVKKALNTISKPVSVQQNQAAAEIKPTAVKDASSKDAAR
jgi:hypothetical protein